VLREADKDSIAQAVGAHQGDAVFFIARRARVARKAISPEVEVDIEEIVPVWQEVQRAAGLRKAGRSLGTDRIGIEQFVKVVQLNADRAVGDVRSVRQVLQPY